MATMMDDDYASDDIAEQPRSWALQHTNGM
jgi:hypothetical protein